MKAADEGYTSGFCQQVVMAGWRLQAASGGADVSSASSPLTLKVFPQFKVFAKNQVYLVSTIIC